MRALCLLKGKWATSLIPVPRPYAFCYPGTMFSWDFSEQVAIGFVRRLVRLGPQGLGETRSERFFGEQGHENMFLPDVAVKKTLRECP